jgi:hypothetical protein
MVVLRMDKCADEQNHTMAEQRVALENANFILRSINLARMHNYHLQLN